MTTLADLTWPVRTERLLLRPLTLDDADAVWAYRQLPAVCRWTGSLAPDREGFEKRFLTPERLPESIVVEHEGRIVGDLMVIRQDGWAQVEAADQAAKTQAELGWTFDPVVTSRGVATEAVAAQLRICFDGLGLRRVTALCFAANERSWRLMERVGMRRESHNVQDSLHAELGWMDGYGYALLADEWGATLGQHGAG